MGNTELVVLVYVAALLFVVGLAIAKVKQNGVSPVGAFSFIFLPLGVAGYLGYATFVM